MSDTAISQADIAAKKALPQIVFQTLPIAQLAAGDLPHDTGAGDGHSSKESSIILPIIVCASSKKARYIVLDGYKRFYYLKKLRHKNVPCGVVKSLLPEDERLLLRLKLNAGRRFALKEKLAFLKAFSSRYSQETIAHAISILGISEQEKIMLSTLASAQKELINAVAKEQLHIHSIRQLMLMSKMDQHAFLKAFKNAQLSFQTQREFLEWLIDISYAEKSSVRSILAHSKIQAILRNRRINWPQRIEKIREILYHRRYPRRAALEKKWRTLAAGVNPRPSIVHFIPSPSFEKNRLELRITLSKPQTASELFSDLAKIPNSTWKSLMYPG
jgi:hypothetical protein